MRFFIPHTKDSTDIEEVYSAILKHNNGLITDKRIFKITFYSDGKKIVAEVGKPLDGTRKEGDQLVIAIVEAENWYCVCLPTRGVLKGVPIYVGKKEHNIHLEYFD